MSSLYRFLIKNKVLTKGKLYINLQRWNYSEFCKDFFEEVKISGKKKVIGLVLKHEQKKKIKF